MTTQLEHMTEVAPNGFFAQRSGHEQVVFCQDERSGLKAIIAIYSTALGPSLGGTRFYPYPSEDAALADVLRLSRAMAYKSAVAGLNLGGGKAVIIGDPATDRSPDLLRAYGRFVESLGGRYITACDVGTYAQDMDVVATETRHVTGRSEANGGAGDSSVLTAYGVSRAMRAAAEHLWGASRLRGRRVGVEGVGKVGAKLVEHLLEAGATVVVCDPDRRALERVTARRPEVATVPDASALRSADLDVYAPCALGASLSAETVAELSARLVCGGANNQLADPSVEQVLQDKNILYLPDYVVNAGGLIQVADEIGGFDFDRAHERTTGIYQTTKRILAIAAETGVAPNAAADQLARRRMSEAAGLRQN